jgi:hypothetical protein
MLGTLEEPDRGPQFLLCEHWVKEFVANGVAIWVGRLLSGYVVCGGSATYLARNVDVFTSNGIKPGSNPSGYYAGLAALFRTASDRMGSKIALSASTLGSWPSNGPEGLYSAELPDPNRPEASRIWRIEPQDEVAIEDLYPELPDVFKMAYVIDRWAGDPLSIRVRQILMVHTNHVFESAIDHFPAGQRLIVGSPLYVEQLKPSG